jgi:hypothetical protein
MSQSGDRPGRRQFDTAPRASRWPSENCRSILDCQLNMMVVRDIAFGLRSAIEVGRPRIRYLLSGANRRLIEWLTIVIRAG